MINRDRVLVDHAVISVMSALKPHPFTERPEEVADMEGIGSGLDT